MRLRHTRVLVTGSTSGIGEAVALRLASEGADTVISGRNRIRGQIVVERASRLGPGRATFIHSDLSTPHGPEELAGAAEKLSGGVDVLVNNAGVWAFGESHSVGPEELISIFAVNVRGPFLLSTNIMEKMAVRGQGSVINVTSAAAYRGYPGLAAYGALKAALESLTKSWAAEFGGKGIRVNSVSPGQIFTPGIPITSEELNGICSPHGLGRHGYPEDVAEAVAFLAGNDAGYLSGSVLHVDGGMLQTQAHGPIRLH